MIIALYTLAVFTTAFCYAVATTSPDRRERRAGAYMAALAAATALVAFLWI